MSTFPGPSNPIVYAQFVLQGKWWRMLIIAGIYSMVVAGLLSLADFHGKLTPRDYMAFLGMLTGLQALVLFGFGTFRVESAVRTDVTNRMLESHRLMPASPLGSIFGYLLGAPLQAIMLAMVNFLLGTICCVLGGLAIGPWAFANGVLLFMALVIYALIVQLAFLIRGGFIIVLFAGFMFPSLGASGAIPSLHALLFPLISRESPFVQMFNSSSSPIPPNVLFAFAVSILSQLIIAAVAIRVAVRRYVSPAVVGISPLLGLILLATWVGLALADFIINARGTRSPLRFSNGDDQFLAEVVSSLTTALFLATLPIASAARTASLAQRSASPRWLARFSPLWTLLAAYAILAALLVGICAMQVRGTLRPALISAGIMLNFLITIACLFSQGYLRRRRPWVLVTFWLLLTWAAPAILDAIYCAAVSHNDPPTSLTAVSVPGAFYLLWDESTVALEPGIVAQIVLTLIAAGLLLQARLKTFVRSTPAPAK